VRIALDATYSIDPYPSGIAVYSRRLLAGLAAAYTRDQFIHCYRPKQLLHAPAPTTPNVRRALLLGPLPAHRSAIFHALNQRVDRRYARAVVSTFHDLFVMTAEYSSDDFRARFTSQAKIAACNSDLIIAVSEFTASQVVELLNVPRSRIRVVPHGVDLAEVDETARRKEILFVGALQKRKNVIRLVQAFEELKTCWTLVLAGSPTGFGAREILDRISESPARERIRIEGYVPAARLERLYSQAAIFTLPSLDEGFGIPVLEAMAHGVPVVTSCTSALGELGRDVALLVDPCSVGSISTALQSLVQNESLRSELAKAGLERAGLYPWARAIESTRLIYDELIG
jgi:glycosyltransferase involved in cell wall biosynthesis